jgi:hypothetical protein
LTRVPTQITCQIFKEHPQALRLRGSHIAARAHDDALLRSTGERGRKYSHRLSSVNLLFCCALPAPWLRPRPHPGHLPPHRIARLWLQGARSIAPIGGLSTHCHNGISGRPPDGQRRAILGLCRHSWALPPSLCPSLGWAGGSAYTLISRGLLGSSLHSLQAK